MINHLHLNIPTVAAWERGCTNTIIPHSLQPQFKTACTVRHKNMLTCVRIQSTCSRHQQCGVILHQICCTFIGRHEYRRSTVRVHLVYRNVLHKAVVTMLVE